MLDVAQYILTDVKTVLMVPASVIFTDGELAQIAFRNDITWGDAEHTLIRPARLVDIDLETELADVLRVLDAAKVYIDLEN